MEHKFPLSKALNLESVNKFQFLVGFKTLKKIDLVQVRKIDVSSSNCILSNNMLEHIS